MWCLSNQSRSMIVVTIKVYTVVGTLYIYGCDTRIAQLWHRCGGLGKCPLALTYRLRVSHISISRSPIIYFVAFISRQLHTLVLIRNLGCFKLQILIFYHVIPSALVIVKTTIYY